MSLTIELPKELEASLASRARAVHMPTERYVASIIEHALERQRHRAAKNLERSLDEIAAAVPEETTSEEMEAALEDALTAIRPRRVWRR